ncbi:adenosine kinase-like [Drosophila innubila]|uniref:adenosine kinase-like n=1 Tax=Drosophila innubila TaxID=198719 RepID=UPI00148C7780|nr:adenosine kinase-like [Drosophila innubila]
MKHILRIPRICQRPKSCRANSRKDSDIPEGVLIGFGNPLLDITTTVRDNVILQKYGLAENAAIIAQERHIPLFDELSKMKDVTYSAGGSCQNSIRVFQWIVTKPFCAYFIGAVGKDKFGETMAKRAISDGVQAIYQTNDKAPTGTCAVIVNGLNRSLVANLGASAFFSETWLNDKYLMCVVNRAKYFYTTGFFVAVSSGTVLKVAKISSSSYRTFVLNFSAVFVLTTQKAQLDEILPYTDIIIGNKEEVLAFADTHDWKTSDTFEIGKRLQCLPKDNKRPRIVMITDSECPVLCFQKNGEILAYPVPKVDKSVIVDTNGCGDAFVGGFLSQLVQDMPLDYCIRTGIFASQQVLRIVGVQIDKLPKFKEICF